MQVSAQLNNLRIAPRKVRLVAGVIKGMDVARAQSQLNFLVKKSANPLNKLLKSAVSNAENNFGLVKDNLYIKNLVVNEGVKIKRFMPRAMGQTAMIQKKTSRIKITLEEKVPGLKAPKITPKPESMTMKEIKETKFQDRQKDKKLMTVKQGISKKGVFDGVKDISRKLFRRKSV